MSDTRGSAARVTTGIDGLDAILGGGLPRRRLYLVQGTPGAGKTTLALQYLLAGQAAGEPGLYITLSEMRDEVVDVATIHGWSLEEMALVTLETVDGLIKGEAQTTVFHPSEVELAAVVDLIRSEAARVRPTRVVLDSLSELRLLAERPLRHRHQLLEFKRLFSDLGCTTLMLDDKNFGAAPSDPHVLSLAHGVIELEQLAPEYGVPRRRLQVSKLRGVKPREGCHDFVIETGGLRVFPRLVAAQHDAEFRPRPVASGNVELDALLGGGIDRGTTTLISGASGTGKSSLALLYAARLADQGEGVMLFTFDETAAIARARARALGLDLTAHIDSGQLALQQVDPAEISPGEFAHRVQRGVEAGVGLVVVDSLNGYVNAMPGERYLVHQLHELTGYLNQHGVATVLIATAHGMFGQTEMSFELTYLADTVISMRYFETQGEVRKAVAVVKKRSGRHENTIREIRFASGTGIEVGPPLVEFAGVLGGNPRYLGRADEILGR
jgi:circadian clock protein KaiC